MPVLIIGIFAAALWALSHQLREIRLSELFDAVRDVPLSSILTAVALTAASYVVLTGYDALALRYIGRTLPYRTVAAASFIGYAFSNNFGIALITGGSIRYRLYSLAGLSAGEIARVVAFCTLTFLFGTVVVGAIAFLAVPAPALAAVTGSATATRGVAALFLVALAGVAVWSWVRRRPIAVGRWTVNLPSAPMMGRQVGLAAADIVLAGLALYILLPEMARPALPLFAGVFVLATAAGAVSNVPGGLGVFETVILLGLPDAPPDAVVAAILAYRGVYFLLPLGLAAFGLGWQEVAQRRGWAVRLDPGLARLFARITPLIIGSAVLVAGIVLLVSKATPEPASRIAVLRDIVPLPLLELSSLLRSATGFALIILARSLFRRLDAAYTLTVALLGAGAILSVLDGLAVETAAVLTLVLLAMLPSHSAFYRKASLFAQPFTPGWLLMLGLAIAGFLWLGFFSFKHVDYSQQLWWRFAFYDEAPRFLRGAVVIGLMAVGLGLVRLLRPAPPSVEPMDPGQIEKARAIVAQSPSPEANLALLGDKRLMFHEAGDAFLMYAVSGNHWIAMGDPVGPEERHADLVWAFRELCDRHDDRPVFYQVRPQSLPLYIDLGLTLTKLGEEARVRLEDFSLEGKGRKDLRYIHRRVGRDGASFELVPPEGVAALLPALKEVSDRWLAEKNVQEKRFSVGCFDPAYLSNFPCGVVRANGAIVAFATLWPGAGKSELTVDLMRYSADAPASVMEYLFVELMLWGQSQGYGWFNLGMAPLSGLENNPLAPTWQRAGAFLFRQGEQFYNFQGLRRYKEKFDPQWQPKYMASVGGLALATTLLAVASLIAGGVKGMVRK